METFEDVKKSGLFGSYTAQEKVRKHGQVGTKKNKIPIFKERRFTKKKLDDIKTFLEMRTHQDVIRMLAPTASTVKSCTWTKMVLCGVLSCSAC